MKKITLYITLALLVIGGFQAVAPAAGPPALAGGGRLQGILLTGDPGAMHRVLISFETRPGEPEHARVKELGGRVRHAYRLVPAICAHLPEAAIHAFARRPEVVRIEADGRVRAVDELSSAWGVAAHPGGDRPCPKCHGPRGPRGRDRHRHRLQPP